MVEHRRSRWRRSKCVCGMPHPCVVKRLIAMREDINETTARGNWKPPAPRTGDDFAPMNRSWRWTP